MDPKHLSNAILVGAIDSFCLACQLPLRGAGETRSHIAAPDHRDRFNTLQVLDKHKDDQILKVKQGYFCVYCNTVFPTATKVMMHVADALHKANKGGRQLRRKGDAIFFHDLLLDGDAWHGIVGDMCSVCNVEFLDATAHKGGATHSFNLARNNVEFSSGKDIYRKIDETTFQCITCNIVLPLQIIMTHFEEPDHKNTLLKCAQTYTDVTHCQQESSKTDKANNVRKYNLKSTDYKNTDNSSQSSEGFVSAECSSDESDAVNNYNKEENITKMLESVSIFERNEINVYFESETARCKKCLNNVDFDFKTIEGHIEEHRKDPKKRDVGYQPFQCEVNMRNIRETATAAFPDDYKMRLVPSPLQKESNKENVSEGTTRKEVGPAEFAKANEITYNVGNNDAYCRLCSVRMPSNLQSLMEHVNGKRHKICVDRNVETEKHNEEGTERSERNEYGQRVKTEDYLEHVCNIRCVRNLFRETVVNERFCMDTLSFQFITKFEGRLRCQLCEESLMEYELERHQASLQHRWMFRQVAILPKYHNEFIREVREGVFHCGFCNLLEAGGPALRAHLGSIQHSWKRKQYQAKLAEHLPLVREQMMRDRIQAMFGFPYF